VDPRLFRLRVAAGRRALIEYGLSRLLQPAIDLAEFRRILDLDAKVIDALALAPRRDGEVDPRIVQHPLGVVWLHHRRLGGEQTRVEPDRLVEVGNGDIHVKALHCTDPCCEGVQQSAGLPGAQQSFRTVSNRGKHSSGRH
jgi:hypothetical protein